MKNIIENKHLEIFEAKFNELISIVLTVKFTKKDFNYIVEASKFKLKIESTNDNINDAREEFADVFSLIIKNKLNNKTLFKSLDYLKFKIQPYNQVIQQKKLELETFKKNANLVSVDQDKLMAEAFININRINPSINWSPSI